MARQALPILKGACSGLIWSLLPLLLFRPYLERFPATWILASGVLTGLIITLLILPLRNTLQTWKRRLITSLPILAVAQGVFAFFLPLRATWEGAWPERWTELILAIYWVDVAGLHSLLYLPLTYITVWWVLHKRPLLCTAKSME